jgi:hypothetical protein
LIFGQTPEELEERVGSWTGYPKMKEGFYAVGVCQAFVVWWMVEKMMASPQVQFPGRIVAFESVILEFHLKTSSLVSVKEGFGAIKDIDELLYVRTFLYGVLRIAGSSLRGQLPTREVDRPVNCEKRRVMTNEVSIRK